MLTRIFATVLAAAMLLAGPACKRRDRARIQQTEEEGPQLASTIHMGDPRAATQLVSGFYDIEVYATTRNGLQLAPYDYYFSVN